MFKKMKKGGFTLVELLVVIAIIGILAAMLFPAIQGALLQAAVRQTANRGAQVAKSLYARNLDRSQVGWPETYALEAEDVGLDWESSDGYWLDIIGGLDSGESNAYFNTIAPLGDVDFTYVGAGGGQGATPLSGAVTNDSVRTRFTDRNLITGRTGAHNAWCVTLTLNSSAKASIPFMFTKNLRFQDEYINSLELPDFTSTGDPTTGPLNENVDILGGKKALAIGMQGNAINFAEENYITRELFNPTDVKKKFIWPAGEEEPTSETE